jgi:hypothetical protein
VDLFEFNNTTDYPCGEVEPSVNTITITNQHYIGYQSATCTGTCGTALALAVSGGSSTTNNGTHLFQPEATANGQGYVAGNNYAPTVGGSTIGAGTDLTSFCNTISDPVASAACKSGTSGGVAEVAGQGGMVVSYPAIPINPRGSTWDVGAYQYSGLYPPTGLAALVQ